jgi:hypothetical protein
MEPTINNPFCKRSMSFHSVMLLKVSGIAGATAAILRCPFVCLRGETMTATRPTVCCAHCRTPDMSAHAQSWPFAELGTIPFTGGCLSNDAIAMLKNELVFRRAV